MTKIDHKFVINKMEKSKIALRSKRMINMVRKNLSLNNDFKLSNAEFIKSKLTYFKFRENFDILEKVSTDFRHLMDVKPASLDSKQKALEGFYVFKAIRNPSTLFTLNTIWLTTIFTFFRPKLHSYKKTSQKGLHDLDTDLCLPFDLLDDKLLYDMFIYTIVDHGLFLNPNGVNPNTLITLLKNTFFKVFKDDIEICAMRVFIQTRLIKFLHRSDVKKVILKQTEKETQPIDGFENKPKPTLPFISAQTVFYRVFGNEKEQQQVSPETVQEQQKKALTEDEQIQKLLDRVITHFMDNSRLQYYRSSEEFLDSIYLFIFNKMYAMSSPNKRVDDNESPLYAAYCQLYSELWNELELRYVMAISKLFCNFIESRLLVTTESVRNIFKEQDSEKGAYFYLELSMDPLTSKPIFFISDYDLLLELEEWTTYFHTNLPMVVEPANWTLDRNYVSNDDGGYLFNKIYHHFKLVKPVDNCIVDIRFSNKTIDVLNLLQKKVFKLNKNFSSLLLTEYSLYVVYGEEFLNDLDNDFEVFNSKVTEFESWLDSIDLNLYKFLNDLSKYREIYGAVLEGNTSRDLINTLKIMARETNTNWKTFQWNDYIRYVWSLNTKSDFRLYDDFLTQYKDLVFRQTKLVDNNRIQMKRLIPQAIAAGFDSEFYIPSQYCFRLRNYPLTTVLGRTSGLVKHLFGSSKAKRFDERGIYWLLLTIVKCLGFKASNLEGYEKLVKNIAEMILTNFDPLHRYKFFYWFKFNYPDNKISNYDYCLLCIVEYYSHINDSNYKSNLILFVDQVASGPQILSILFGNKPILELTNVISGDQQNDLYVAFISSLKNELKKNTLTPKYQVLDKAIDMVALHLNRSLAKQILIPLFYGMQPQGLFKLIENEIFPSTSSCVTDIPLFRNTTMLNLFHNLFLESSLACFSLHYKGLLIGFDLLKDLANAILSEKGFMRFKTLDDSVILYNYQYTTSHQLSIPWRSGFFKETVTKLLIFHDSFSVNKPNYKTASAFPAHFIQAIDGAMARAIINKMHEKHQIIVEPLHDSFGCHPNDIDNLLTVVNDVYSTELIKPASDIISDCILKVNYIENGNMDTKLYYKLAAVMENYNAKLKDLDSISSMEILERFKNAKFNFFP